ncbi:response regulator [Thaumasiovibrio subtropicus]|uniref:response regulator n=1 Tax=Thaumasiovibrio subtropicus TaxID=1891207 RepID=UPI000B360F22|nr:response regulator [Thaumasiovibrio subtropicus]
MLDGKEVLIVEDDPIFRNMIVQYLKTEGCQISEAENGLEGLRALRNSIPDLLLCDLSMPVMNGMEFVEEVSVQYPMLPVVVLSGTEKMSDVATALRLGVKDFLIKPLSDIRSLGTALSSVLSTADDAISHQHDFSHHWFDVNGMQAQNDELERHLNELQENPVAARDLLVGLMPNTHSKQGDWELRYQVLQSAEVSPVLLDYTWLMDGRLAFYLIDSDSAKDAGTATTLLIRAFFNDYLRTQLPQQHDITELVKVLENGIMHSGYATPVKGIFGIFNACDCSLQIVPTGIGANLITAEGTRPVAAMNWLGKSAQKNPVLRTFLPDSGARLSLSELGSATFSITIGRTNR